MSKTADAAGREKHHPGEETQDEDFFSLAVAELMFPLLLLILLLLLPSSILFESDLIGRECFDRADVEVFMATVGISLSKDEVGKINLSGVFIEKLLWQ